MKDTTTLKLKEIGLKVTPQRQAILKLLQGNETHPSAENIYSEILKRYPGVSFATVYNTLSKLVKAGKIQKLDIDPNKKRFDPQVNPHPHFYCQVCGRVYDMVYNSPLPMNMKKKEGHQVDVIQLNLKGICKDCKRNL